MLPSEKALAAELKVSVMTLRKALALLEEEKVDRAAARQRNLHCA
ncbi:HTH-type transcriptional regulator YidP [Klebsiella pneumoniae IS53]|nr:HTH-type transcriptional regulator YidP [Klebsiella pneumoniae IS53]